MIIVCKACLKEDFCHIVCWPVIFSFFTQETLLTYASRTCERVSSVGF